MKEFETVFLEKALYTAKDASSFIAEYEKSLNSASIHELLAALIRKYGVKKKQAVLRSQIPKSTAYQILSGFKNPSRDRLIMLGIGIKLSIGDMQSLLAKAGYRKLYPKDCRDIIISQAFTASHDLVKINMELDRMSLKLLV